MGVVVSLRYSLLQQSRMKYILVLVCLLQLSAALFFSVPSCRSDRSCPAIRRRTGSGTRNIGGRCLTRQDGLCQLGRIFGGKRDCTIRRCARCLISEDCASFCEDCRANQCVNVCNNYNYGNNNNYGYNPNNNYGYNANNNNFGTSFHYSHFVIFVQGILKGFFSHNQKQINFFLDKKKYNSICNSHLYMYVIEIK